MITLQDSSYTLANHGIRLMDRMLHTIQSHIPTLAITLVTCMMSMPQSHTWANNQFIKTILSMMREELKRWSERNRRGK